MANRVRSTNLYSHPFSRAYWKDAASELKDTKMLVITALMIALRIALKPLAIFQEGKGCEFYEGRSIE